MVRYVIPDIVNGQSLVTLPPSATVRQAARKMERNNVRSVLVTRGKKLIGIFTGTDMTCRVVAAGLDPETTRLSDVMTGAPHTIGPRDNAIDALNLMHRNGYRHLPVTDGSTVVGVLSRRDFLEIEEDEIERQEQIWQEL
jgi:CBS domain-containing protein